MKKIVMAVMFLCLVVLASHGVQAQVYDPYYSSPYWNGAQYQADPQEYDPYYELHAMHYQLYLPQYQLYSLCCFQRGILVPGWAAAPVIPLPPVIINPSPRMFR